MRIHSRFVFPRKALGVWYGRVSERAIRRLPLVRSVYSSVKRVTNFVLVDKQVQYKRVVAVEYPRKGIWSIGLVTSDGVSDVVTAAREPCVTVVLPGSPTPITGYCVMVPTRETHDLNLTIDQALQFYVSCGVAVPKSQHVERVNSRPVPPPHVLRPLRPFPWDPTPLEPRPSLRRLCERRAGTGELAHVTWRLNFAI